MGFGSLTYSGFCAGNGYYPGVRQKVPRGEKTMGKGISERAFSSPGNSAGDWLQLLEYERCQGNRVYGIYRKRNP